MNRFDSINKPLMWFLAILLATLVVACGGNRILGSDGTGVIVGAPPGSIIPGGVCTAAPGPTIPKVDSSIPSNGATNVSIGTGVKTITATFSMAMNPATINSATPGALSTFTLKDMTSGAGTIVPATVAMNGPNTVATLTTSSPLLPNTTYAAVITIAATSTILTGSVPLGCTYAWNFKTAAAVVPLAINLGSAASFGIASSAGLSSTGVTVVNGDIALSPTATCTDATGNAGAAVPPPGCAVKAYGSHPTGLTVNGSVYFAADPFDSGVTAAKVKTDLNAAWVEGKAKVDTFATGFLSGQLGGPGSAGKVLLAGVYHEATLNFAANTVVTFDAQNDPNAIFIIKIDSSFTDSGTLLLPTQVKLANQAQARNIWFVVGLDATIGHGTAWSGNILAGQTVTVLDSSTVVGRVLGGAISGGSGAITLTGAASPSVTSITVP